MFMKIGRWFKKRFSSEQRSRSRVEVGFEAFIEVDGTHTSVHTENLSMKGALCIGEYRFEPGQPCNFILPVAPGIRIVIEGSIVRSDTEYTAIEFLAMDPDSFVHLRRMVELNATNPDAIEDEIIQGLNRPESRKS